MGRASIDSALLVRIIRLLFGALLTPFLLIGCGYYPHNQAAVAVPGGQTLTMTGAILPTKVRMKGNEYDDIVRLESLTSATWKLGTGNIFLSPSLFYLGFGSGAGYVFDSKTVVAGFAGTSFYPVSLASGISVSQAFLRHYFIEYRLNYSKLHYENCAFGCYETDEGEFRTYHTLDFAMLFGKFYSEFNLETADLKKEYLTYGISVGVQIHK